MSQFESHFDQTAGAPRTTSKLAVTALVSSLIFFCPITTLLGPILGLIALGTMGSEKKGKGLAITSILIGVILTALWAYFGNAAYNEFKKAIVVVMDGPKPALVAGFGDDVAGFKDQFYGDGAAATDADAIEFISAMRERYGEYVSCQFDQNTNQPQAGQPSAPFQYQITFDQKVVDCEAEIIFADQVTGKFIMKLGYIIMSDEELGDLEYPPSSSP